MKDVFSNPGREKKTETDIKFERKKVYLISTEEWTKVFYLNIIKDSKVADIYIFYFIFPHSLYVCIFGYV